MVECNCLVGSLEGKKGRRELRMVGWSIRAVVRRKLNGGKRGREMGCGKRPKKK